MRFRNLNPPSPRVRPTPGPPRPVPVLAAAPAAAAPLPGSGISNPVFAPGNGLAGNTLAGMEANQGVLFNVGLFVAFLLIIVHFGRPFDRFPNSLHIPAIICSFGIVAVFFAGAWKPLFTKVGIPLCLFLGWMMLATPFSTWRGGSAKYVFWFVVYWVMLMLLVGHTPRTLRDLVRLGSLVGIACLLNVVVGTYGFEGNRLTGAGTFGNSNDLALQIGFAIPFVILLGQQFKNPILRKVVIVVPVAYLVYSLGRTASRTAFVATFCMLGLYFLRGRLTQKLTIAVLTVFGLLLMAVLLPDRTIDRISSVFESFSSSAILREARTDEAMASAEERRELLEDTLTMISQHPLLGVGPGQFEVYRFQYLKKKYFPSHNTYAQIGAESGLPAILIYVFFLWSIFRTLRRIRKTPRIREHPDAKLIFQIILCLDVAFVYFLVFAFFLTCDRYPHPYLVAGIAIALERMLQPWVAQQQQTPQFAGASGQNLTVKNLAGQGLPGPSLPVPVPSLVGQGLVAGQRLPLQPQPQRRPVRR